jgi:hypothetical protein
MISVVFECVACHRMSKNCEPAAVHNEPWNHLGKLVGVERKPAASARVRADGLIVQWSDRKAKGLAGRFGELSGFLAARRIEVNVGVIACNNAHPTLPR